MWPLVSKIKFKILQNRTALIVWTLSSILFQRFDSMGINIYLRNHLHPVPFGQRWFLSRISTWNTNPAMHSVTRTRLYLMQKPMNATVTHVWMVGHAGIYMLHSNVTAQHSTTARPVKSVNWFFLYSSITIVVIWRNTNPGIMLFFYSISLKFPSRIQGHINRNVTLVPQWYLLWKYEGLRNWNEF